MSQDEELDKILKPWSNLIVINYGEPSSENTHALSLFKVHEEAKQAIHQYGNTRANKAYFEAIKAIERQMAITELTNQQKGEQ